MKKPKLADYGLKGIDQRPQIDVDASPISFQERAEAVEALIRHQVESSRVRKFRHDLNDYDWERITR